MEKLAIFQSCINHINEKISQTKKQLEAAQLSANSETKSSAGDKYETGRAMAQIERDKYAQQLAVLNDQFRLLSSISIETASTQVEAGSLVKTNIGLFFFSTALGQLTSDKTSFFALSMTSPLGQKLLGKTVSDSVDLNGRTITIETIY